MSDHDAGVDHGPLPGSGTITCRQLDASTDARALRLALKFGKLLVELFP